MTIGTNAAIFFHEASQVDLEGGSGSSAVADGGVSTAGVNGLTAWTNTDDAPEATFVFEGTFASAPAAGGSLILLAQKTAVRSTNNDEVPTANHPHTFIGRFPIKDTASAQRVTVNFPLPDWKSQSIYQFHVLNKSGVSLNAGWKVYADAMTIGPHA